MSEQVRTVSVRLTGESPLLLHADNLEFQDWLKEWREDPENKDLSSPGDDRTPAFTWLGCLFTNQDGVVGIPTDYVMAAIRQGAALVTLNKRTTFKARSQSGIVCLEQHWPLLVNGATIPLDPIDKLRAVPKFKDHVDAVAKMGFSLFVKRAKIGRAKHVRVRPRFDQWSCEGTFTITDELIDDKVLLQILTNTGKYKGIGDWRPGGPTPGPWGMFKAEVLG